MKKIVVGIFIILIILTGCSSKTNTKKSEEEKKPTVVEKKKTTVEDYYGTWESSKLKRDGSTFTVEELEKLGTYEASGLYIVIKEGGNAYLYMKEDDMGNVLEYEFDDSDSSLTIGTNHYEIVDGDLVYYADNGTELYFKKVSNSQDISELPTNKEETTIEETDNKVEEKQEDTKVNESVIRPEVKDAIDSYEAFIDEYCEFLKKYEASDGSDYSILADYAVFLGKYTEMESKMEKLEGDLTDAEYIYYSEVMLRCSQKLIETSY